ncbi:MAG: hypothetical protein EOO65_00590 [Methanosarcinales archaeon]|nr:MAG: hypothetical protein EOO65_00590 [Methanosarcinales archaeon]
MASITVAEAGQLQTAGDSDEQRALRVAAEKSLWKWNLAMGILHLIQAVIVLALGLADGTTASNFRIPQTTQFVGVNPTTGFFEQQLVRRYTIPFVALASGFAWMSAAAHFLVLLFFKQYVKDLRTGVNQFRWWEYSASSSLMIVLIAMLFGIWDIISLTLLGSLNACMNIFGLWMELGNRQTGALVTGKVDWLPFIAGSFAGIVPWGCIFAFLGAWDSSRVPKFVYGILAAYFIMFLTFPINMILQYLRVGPYAPRKWGTSGHSGYYFGEKVYQILSLVAKSLLLWLVVGGFNSPNEFTGRGVD